MCAFADARPRAPVQVACGLALAPALQSLVPFETVDDIPGIAFRQKRELRCRVERIADGDTYRVTHLGARLVPAPITQLLRRRHEHVGRGLTNRTLMVRIAAVDTPETAKFGKEAQPLGDEATQFAKAELLGRVVNVRLLSRDQCVLSRIARAAARARAPPVTARALAAGTVGRSRACATAARCASCSGRCCSSRSGSRSRACCSRTPRSRSDCSREASPSCTDRCRRARAARCAHAARTPVSPPPPPARALRFAQGGAQYDGPLERWNRLEARAKAKRLGVWRQKGGFESPAEYKRRQRG